MMKTTRGVKSPTISGTLSGSKSTPKGVELLEKNRQVFEKLFNQKIDAYDRTQGNLIVYPLEIHLGDIPLGETTYTLFAVHVNNGGGSEKKENIRIELPEDCMMKTNIQSYGYTNRVTLEILPSEAKQLNTVIRIYTEKYSYNLPLVANVVNTGQKSAFTASNSFILTSPQTGSPVKNKKLSEYATPILLDSKEGLTVKTRKNEFSEKEPFEFGKRHRTVMFMWD
eukprot:gnl/Chilomastix_caulleri/587.p1 GENE.gnl/Chilomastix_caulleri/587~~gnl/Chilomastix_caulleri/587.p1  ORF type:complete len:225 (+),score=55.05 gnl/Chilomastix_caulleri/587:178-852(+)